MVAPHVIRRTIDRALEQVADAFLQDAIHGQTDGVFDPLGLQVVVDVSARILREFFCESI
jgi:capsule polysaccharide modification protein KpsS